MTVTGLEGFVQNWCSGGKKASLLFSSWFRNRKQERLKGLIDLLKLNRYSLAAYVNAGCGRVQLVFGQGWRGRWRQPGWWALIEEDAAV